MGNKELVEISRATSRAEQLPAIAEMLDSTESAVPKSVKNEGLLLDRDFMLDFCV